MKKSILSTALILLAPILLLAQNSEIRGSFKNYSKNPEPKVYLFSISEGESIELATTTVINGEFGFLFNAPYEGFYIVGGSESVKTPQFPVYLKPGDKVAVDIDGYNIKFTGKPTKENAVLGQWIDISGSVGNKSIYFYTINSIYKDFFPELEAVASQKDSFKKSINTGNKKFDDMMRKFVDCSLDYYAINFIQTPRSEHPSFDQLSPYYASISKGGDLSDNTVLEMPYSKRFINSYLMWSYMTQPKDGEKREEISFLGTDLLKGEYAADMIFPRCKSYIEFESSMEKYGKYLTTDKQKKRVEDMGAKLVDTKPGAPATDFTYPDINGKMVSLSDFKGKVVLVDVWATWCGPCKAEIPALKKLTEELKSETNFVVMSVSVDEDKDKAKWESYVKDENLGGVQLFASGWSKIAKDYKITGIPRFMLFDKQGNIIASDSPRPSNPELKKIILEYLKK